jgi:hypothetical protein
VLNLDNPNQAMACGGLDIWGHDPFVPRRYAEFMAATQGQDPAAVTQDVCFQYPSPLFGAMLRCRFLAAPETDGQTRIRDLGTPAPLCRVVRSYRVLSGRTAVLAAVTADGFDPATEVILEQEPDPGPASLPAAGAGPDAVTVTDAGTDHLEIEADLGAAGILVLTEGYSRGWRARALAGSSQDRYTVLAANYVLRAIPLAAGRHRIRLDYVSRGFAVGRWISLVSAAAWLAVMAATWPGHRTSVRGTGEAGPSAQS